MKNIVTLIDTSKRKQLLGEDTVQKLSGMNVRMGDVQKPLSAQNLAPYLEEANIIITSWGFPRLDRILLDAAPHLEFVLYAAGSVKGIVTDEVWERNIRISSAASALSRGVGETALGLTIVSLKNVWALAQNTQQGGWGEGKNNVKELFGVTIGVVGAGHAGRHYIDLLRHFDVHIVVYDPTLDAADPLLQHVQQVELSDLLQQSDVVSIHAPSIPATYKMFTGERLAQMKDGATLINTARGTIIDEQALSDELRSGRINACIDVTDPEPPAKDHPFRLLPNVVLTPHIAGAVNNGLQRIGKFVADELERYLEGRKLKGEVTPIEYDILA